MIGDTVNIDDLRGAQREYWELALSACCVKPNLKAVSDHQSVAAQPVDSRFDDTDVDF